MYKLVNLDNKLSCIEKVEGNIITIIPIGEANTDYQAYLKWVSEGNTPEAAE